MDSCGSYDKHKIKKTWPYINYYQITSYMNYVYNHQLAHHINQTWLIHLYLVNIQFSQSWLFGVKLAPESPPL